MHIFREVNGCVDLLAKAGYAQQSNLVYFSNASARMDSLVTVDLINSSTTSNAFLSTVVDDCRYLLERFELKSLKHIFREANGCTDLLAKAGYAQQSDLVYFSNASTHVLEALAFDLFNATVN